MKKILFLYAFLLIGVVGFTQSKKEKQLIERTYLLSNTVFGTKDSTTLEDLFARKATYGHSGGKIETREEAVRNISKNKSVYTDTSIRDIKVMLDDDVAIVRYLFKANENKPDGSVTPFAAPGKNNCSVLH